MAIYYGGTKTHAVLNVHYATDTGFGYTTNTSGNTFLQTTFTMHSGANKHIVICTVNGAATDDASGKVEYYTGSSWAESGSLMGATGPGGGGNYRGSFGDWSITRATENKQTLQYTSVHFFDAGSNTSCGYRVRYSCENSNGMYVNRPHGSDGGYNTNTSMSTLLVLEMGE